MAVYLVGLTSGLLLGVLTGGRLRAVVEVAPRWPLTAFGAVAALGVIRLGVGDGGALLALTLGVAAATAAANRHVAGMGVVAVGLVANLVPVVLDGGTPVDRAALEAAGAARPVEGLLPTQHLAGERTSLPALSARIPVPGGFVVSFGDLIIAVGLAAAASSATRRPHRAGIPVRDILASGPLSIDPPVAEVEPGSAVPVPAGWEPADDDAAALLAASLRPRIARSHPTMRLLHR
jgi:hypothetical protein